MKRLASILLLLLYLPAVSGVGVNSFVCCGEVTTVTLQLQAGTPGDSPLQSKGNCCKDCQQVFKIQAPQQVSVNNISCEAPIVPLFFTAHLIPTVLFHRVTICSERLPFYNSSPPHLDKSPLFVQKSSFLI